VLCSACLKQQIFKVYSVRYEDLREIMYFFHSFLNFSDIKKTKIILWRPGTVVVAKTVSYQLLTSDFEFNLRSGLLKTVVEKLAVGSVCRIGLSVILYSIFILRSSENGQWLGYWREWWMVGGG